MLNVGVVGTGSIAAAHVAGYAAFPEECRVVALHDVAASRAHDTKAAFGLVDADVVIAPALAVDSNGVRLGQGGGWYDRALEHVRPGTKVIAVVFPEEVYDATDRPLPLEKHDRTVDAVATPLGWRWLG